jgi:hypothetical protein
MKLSAAVCLAALSACGGGSDSGAGPDPGLYADYVLTSVNGNPLPGLIDQSASSHTFIHSADIRLSANLTFSDMRSSTLTDATGDHPSTVTRTGTFTVNGSIVTLVYQDAFGNGTPGNDAALSGRVMTKTETANATTNTYAFTR